MNGVAPVNTLSIDVSTSMVAVVTLVTVLVFGLATLARPSRATITWGVAFAVGMLGTYLWIGGHQLGLPWLKAASSGFMVSFEPIVWLGLRMHLGKRARWSPVVAFVLFGPALLALTAGTEEFQLSFRVVFLAAGVFAALIAYDLFRMESVARDITLPLSLASCTFVVVAIVGAFSFLFGGEMSPAEQLDILRGVNGVGTMVSGTCAAFTLVLLVRAQPQAVAGDSAAPQRARRRLLKAEAQKDPAWSILDVRMDDEADLREASTGAEFAVIADRFHDDVIEALPASADAHRVDDGRAIVVIRGSDEAIQFHIRAVLTRISAIFDDQSSTSIRVSASVGWAPVTMVGYDYDALVAAAEKAAGTARAEGGDRWARVDEHARSSDE